MRPTFDEEEEKGKNIPHTLKLQAMRTPPPKLIDKEMFDMSKVKKPKAKKKTKKKKKN